jgi:hypothetical protein
MDRRHIWEGACFYAIAWKPFSLGRYPKTQHSHTFWGPTVVVQDIFRYHYFLQSRSTLAAKAISEATLSLYNVQQLVAAY